MKRWRHFIIALGLVPALIVYSVICLVLADYLTGHYWLADIVFYGSAGLLWLYPAGQVITWLAKHEAE